MTMQFKKLLPTNIISEIQSIGIGALRIGLSIPPFPCSTAKAMAACGGGRAGRGLTDHHRQFTYHDGQFTDHHVFFICSISRHTAHL